MKLNVERVRYVVKNKNGEVLCGNNKTDFAFKPLNKIPKMKRVKMYKSKRLAVLNFGLRYRPSDEEVKEHPDCFEFCLGYHIKYDGAYAYEPYLKKLGYTIVKVVESIKEC